MKASDEICRILESMSGKHSIPEIFTDWVTMCAMSIANASSIFRNRLWEEREEAYLAVKRKYEDAETQKLYEMFALLTEEMEEEPSDVLGYVFMKAGDNSSSHGQFFTPYHLSELVARVMEYPQENITLHEPASGSGGLIIAAAMELKNRGVNYQRQLDVVAQDLDWRCVYMCYTQLSLLGIRAICVQGSTLTDPYDENRTPKRNILITPAKAGVLL